MISDISKRKGTKVSRDAIILAIVMIVNVVIIILLTPIGFETRPQSHLKTLGYVAITTIFVCLGLDIASIILLLKRVRVRLASSLVIVTSVAFLLVISVDRTGSFFSVPIPPAINTLEYLFTAVLIVTLFIAALVYRGSKPASS
jgi:cation transport ATPase